MANIYKKTYKKEQREINKNVRVRKEGTSSFHVFKDNRQRHDSQHLIMLFILYVPFPQFL